MVDSGQDSPIVIIGAGLAGLSCAVELTRAGRSAVVLEATDRIGGRVRSDVVGGFTLDHGFQVLLTAYPACQRLLDYEALRLKPFQPGAVIRMGGKFRVLGDPWRRPSDAIATLLNPVGSLKDKLAVAFLRRQSRKGSLAELFKRPNGTTIQRLQKKGFSRRMIDCFFRPFLGGVFLDEDLSTSSRMLDFVFRNFAEGDIAVPADGMAAIPRQLADQLPAGTIRLNQTVDSIDGNLVRLSSGETLQADLLVVAVESNAAARLLESESLATSWNETTNLYYASDVPIHPSEMLILRGDEDGPIQTATVISNVAGSYSPPGKHLLSVTVSRLSDDQKSDSFVLDQAVRDQLASWFGEKASSLEHLATYRIPFALPNRDLDTVEQSIKAEDHGGPVGVFVCGDYCETPSIQGAMNSGIRVAAAICQH